MAYGLVIHPEELSKRWIERANELRLDVLALHPRGGDHADETLAEMLEMLEQPEMRGLIDYAYSLGLSIEYECHAMSYLLPRSLFLTHPEYFRMDENGERTPVFNFCPSCAEALEIVTKNAVVLSERLYRSSSNYYFWLDDRKDSYCHCPKCRSLSPSDQQLIVMNGIVRKLRRHNPTARLCYLAYHECLAPPTTIAPGEGIFLEYAPIERDMHKRLVESGENARKNLCDLVETFKSEGAKVLEYWYDNSLFSDWKKPPKAFVADNALILSDIEFYIRHGFKNISSFACFLGADYIDLFGEPDISAFARHLRPANTE